MGTEQGRVGDGKAHSARSAHTCWRGGFGDWDKGQEEHVFNHTDNFFPGHPFAPKMTRNLPIIGTPGCFGWMLPLKWSISAFFAPTRRQGTTTSAAKRRGRRML